MESKKWANLETDELESALMISKSPHLSSTLSLAHYMEINEICLNWLCQIMVPGFHYPLCYPYSSCLHVLRL